MIIWAATAVAAQSIEIVVHRGANALAPENTWPSADSALHYQAKWIEVDVRKSKDGVLFNLHDETLERTTNGKGKLADMLSEDVRKLDAGSWFGPQFAGLHVPTIAEMLDSLQGKANVFFDVKRGTPIPTLVNLVREKGFAGKSFFWFGDEGMLREFIALAPEMKIKVNAGDIERLKYWQNICKPSYVEIAPEKITEVFRTYCHQHNIKVMAACQEDDTSQFQLVIDKKADLVNLDRPEVFVRLLPSCQAKPGMSTQALQMLIDKMSNDGGGRVTFPKGVYHIGQLELKSGIELHLEDGAIIEDVKVDDIIAQNTGNALFVRLGQRAGNRKGVVKDIHISNLTAQIPFGRPDIDYDLRGPAVDYFHNIHPAPICGIPGNCIEDVTLEHIQITYPGRATKGMAYIPLWRKGDVPEQIQKYPEFTMFGELPSWGLYLRHIRNIKLKDIQLKLVDEDFRPAIVVEDVEGLTTDRIQLYP